MTCRSPKAIEYRSKLGFTQYDITIKKESSVLKSIMEHYEGEDMETQYKVLNYRVDLYFHEYKVAIEIDEKGHKYRYQDYEKQREELIEKLDCVFITINPDEENCKMQNANNKIFRHSKESIKKLTEESTKNAVVEDLEKTIRVVKQLRI